MKFRISHCLAVLMASGGVSAQEPQAVSALGRLEPEHGIIRVAAASTPDAVSGAVLAELHVREGDDIREGDLVAVLDTAPVLTARLQEAHLRIDDRELTYSQSRSPAGIPWAELGVELVLECSGAFKTPGALEPHFTSGAARVVVAHAVKGGTPNIVLGVNDGDFDLSTERLVTAASCTTNCLAPVVRVLHDTIGIERGTVTTIHDPTNTQAVVDRWHKDARRARASQLNLIPTSSNSGYAVTLVIPELAGKLDSMAVRVPVLNASLTDCNFQMKRDTTVEEVNGVLETASQQEPLKGILGFETRPLVSSDYARDPRSAIVDALSTCVTDGRLVKVLAWYDNEWGYANRLVELAALASGTSRVGHAQPA